MPIAGAPRTTMARIASTTSGQARQTDRDDLAGQAGLVEHLDHAVAQAQDVVRGQPRRRGGGAHVPRSQEAR